MSKKILHIMKPEKFNVPFINFIENNFDIINHKFLFLSKKNYDYGLSDDHNPIFIKYNYFSLLKELYSSDKIILHGLWKNNFILLLFLNSYLLKKCYWSIWGGDLYPINNINWIKRQVIKKMGHFVTYIKGDYELIKKNFEIKGQYHESIMYISNLYNKNKLTIKKDNFINIQIGNSGFESNNHKEVFNKLILFKDENIKIYVPLSYGKDSYINEIINEGRNLFGDKFIPITEFMPFDKYLQFLASIDISIFAHNRQQALGNIITLLGLGKKFI